METIKNGNFALATDILIFSISDSESNDCRKLSEKRFNILLVKRNKEPFKDKWCLPGGFVDINETTDDATERILFKETNLKNIYKEQLYTFDEVNRDPRKRIISVAYMSLIDKNQITDKLNEEASWFNLKIIENVTEFKVTMSNENDEINFIAQKELTDKTTNKYQYNIIKDSKMAFDHSLIITTGIMRLRHKAKDTDIVFNLLPDYFTLGELQQVYEIILNKKLLDPAFRRMISSKVEKTNQIKKTGGHRPSTLFKYKDNLNNVRGKKNEF